MEGSGALTLDATRMFLEFGTGRGFLILPSHICIFNGTVQVTMFYVTDVQSFLTLLLCGGFTTRHIGASMSRAV